MTRVVAAVAIGLALASTPAAHHSPTLFDLRTEVTLSGVITTFQFRSPHLGRSVRKSDGMTLRIPWEREEIRKALRDEEASKR